VKKILLVLLFLSCLAAIACLVYFNENVFPQKIKNALISGIENSTGKKVTIGSAKLDVLNGLVIKNLSIYDDEKQILSVKKVSCHFLFIPIFKKEIIATSIRFDSPDVLVERLADNSINIAELFFKKPIKMANGKYSLTISRIMISHGDILFIDRTFEEPFACQIKRANIDVKFFPYRLTFDSEFEVSSRVPMSVRGSGEYKALKKELSARIEARDFCPKDFTVYCNPKKFNPPEGRVDLSADLDYKDSVLNADTKISGINMKFAQGRIDADFSGTIKAKVKYDFAKDELIYSGTSVVKNLALYNLGVADKIYDIRGNISFSDKVLVFNDITATVFGIPVKAYSIMNSAQKPVLKIDIASDLRLSALKNILKSKFGVEIPLEMAGVGELKMSLQYDDLAGKEPAVKGSVYINGAVIKPDYTKRALEDLTGKFDFSQNQLIFKNINFKYSGAACSASGIITNFKAPGIQLEFKSARQSMKALLSVNDKKITISSLAGHYDAYGFSLQGQIDVSDPKNMDADLSGTLAFELAPGKEPYKNFKDKLKDLKISGDIRSAFNFKGNLNDIHNGAIDAEVKCDKLLVSNFTAKDFVCAFSWRDNISNVKRIHASLYGGSLEGNGLLDMTSKDVSYQMNAELKNIKIEELKKDTKFKDRDISGIIRSKFGLKGFSNDMSLFSAWGRVDISRGRLWQLNLFRGIGTLLFRSDFSNVVFEEGSFDFLVKDKVFFTNNLSMKSSLLELNGAVKIGFDKSIAASLSATFTDEGVDAARTSGIAGAIERYSVIEAKGTLDEPNVKVRPDLTAVVSDIADNFFN
jgi:uncharacterized protein involved in outer membrane biogenesis